MHVMYKLNAFIVNRDKLCILPGLTEIAYNKVEKNKVLDFATIHQQLKIPEKNKKLYWKRTYWEQYPILSKEVKYMHYSQHPIVHYALDVQVSEER